MQRINILHLGPGNVGKEFLRQFLENKLQIEKNYCLYLKIIGILNSTYGKINSSGLSTKEIQGIISSPAKLSLKSNHSQITSFINKTKESLIVIDTTASPDTFEILANTLKKSGFTVLSNKKPLTGKLSQFQKLYKYQHRLFIETTVGAGLPIISTIKELLETGDKIIEIQGCFSGTLGFIFSRLEKNVPFSEAIIQAKNIGFTEPDPRDDLSGIDVARKALILGRMMGQKINLTDIKVQSFYPDEYKNITVEDFLDNINTLDDKYRKMMNQAKNQNSTLRYVASVSPNKITVGLKQVPQNSDIGNLDGPDNIVVIRTNQYNKNSLVIKGPGAGVQVTAAGVFGDVLKIIKIINGGKYEKT